MKLQFFGMGRHNTHWQRYQRVAKTARLQHKENKHERGREREEEEENTITVGSDRNHRNRSGSASRREDVRKIMDTI